MFAKLLDTLRAVLGRRRYESELDAELADHIAKYTDDLVAKGVPRGQAQSRARREFGAAERIKDEVRDSQAVTLADSVSRQFRFAFRALGRSPVFTVAAIGTLALGLGASVAVFSVVNAVLLRDLPYPNAGQLYRLYSVTPEGKPDGYMQPHDMTQLYDGHPSVAAAAIGYAAARGRLTDSSGVAHNLNGYNVTEQFFKVFDVPMFTGERFQSKRGSRQIILSYSTWRDLFGSDPGVIGKAIQADDGPRMVVGVAPQEFAMPANTAYWSLFNQGIEFLRGYDGYVRLRQGVPLARFQDQLKTLSADLGIDRTTHRNMQFVARPLLETVVGDLGPTVLILFGASSILLLIACINVANLMLSRGIKRTRELAIREALGARRGHVVRTLMTESFLLSAAGGAAGFLLAGAGVRLLMWVAPADLPRLDTVPIDGTVLLFGVGVTLLTGLLTGLAPAVRISRTDLRAVINDGARGSSTTAAQHRIFGALVIAEIALAVVLVIGAGLVGRSYLNLSTANPGFNTDRLLTVSLESGMPVYRMEMGPDGRPRIVSASYEPVANFYDVLVERIRAIPGVELVTAGASVPLKGGGPRVSVGVVGRPVDDRAGALPQVEQRSVYPDYFRVLGIPLRAGRSLEETDTMHAAGVAVVNEAYVKRYLPGENPLGKRLSLPDQFYKVNRQGFSAGELTPDQVEIVGVVADVKQHSLEETPEPAIYLSNDQYTLRAYSIFVRVARGRPETLASAIRAEIHSMDRTVAPYFTTYPEILRTALARPRMGTTLLVAFSAIALLLAAVGIYGLMSYSVEQRTHEMAVRAAMGASGRDLRALIVRRGLQLGVTGTVLGVIGALALRKVIASQLYEVSALDLRVLLTVPVVLLAVAVMSSYLPAMRAARTDPAELLRAD